MPSATPAFLKAMARAAGLRMTDDGTILSGRSPVYQVRQRPDGTIGETQYFEALDWLRATRADDVALMVAYAQTIRPDDLGVLGLAIKTAPDLRGSLRLVERYFRLLTDTAVYRLDETTAAGHFRLEDAGADNPVHNFRTEVALAAFARNIRCFTGSQATFDGVCFRHAPRAAPDRYAAYFGCPVLFEADSDALVLPKAALDLPNMLGDGAVSAFFIRHMEEQIDKHDSGPDLRTNILHHISSALKSGLPQAADTARALGMSERTLYRRLADEGLTFRDVVREAQEKLACELLSDSTCSIAEIAFLTGFSEQSTFSRAFKRWAGRAPAQYRMTATPS